jgi:ferritin-like metal-binding protein YciE
MNALVPIEQKEVLFYDDTILAVRLADEGVFVPLRPVIEGLGLDWASQTRRINRDPILSDEQKRVVVTTTDSRHETMPREMLCLHLDFLSGFLFGINANRVKSDLRERLIRYQRECYKVLTEAFQEGRLTADPVLDELLQSNSDAVQAYKMLQAMVKLARNQIFLEAQLNTHTTQLTDHEQRLEEIESTLGDTGRNVTPDQASQISQAVKAVAIAQGKQTKKNEFGAVYGELYRKFGITSYKLLPAKRFDEAMGFLTQWHQDLVGDVPF